MPIKVLQFALIQGMNQDISPSKRTDKFAYEIKNMRVTIEDDNTLLAWTSEKGTELIVTQLPNGKVLGSCVINDELILFVKDSTSDTPDCICGIINIDTEPEVIYYYKGNLNFLELNKIETIGVIENSKLHKVYWIDGYNQPRFINIADKTKQYSSDSTLFDFLPTDNLLELTIVFKDYGTLTVKNVLKVDIQKIYLTGLFKAGTVLYAFNYYNLNGAQTNLVYISPLLYISTEKIGGEVDETINCAFKIKCSYVNKDFDYLRIYSISRTSTDTTPLVRIVTDIPTSSITYEEVEYNRPLLSPRRRGKTNYEGITYILYYSNLSGDPSSSYKYKSQGLEGMYVYIKGGGDNGPNEFEQVKLLSSLLDNGSVILNEGDVFRDNNNTYVPVRRSTQLKITAERQLDGEYLITVTNSNNSETEKIYKYNSYNEQITGGVPLEEDTDTINKGILKVPILEFTDNGISGSTFDYNALLFMNNSPIKPSTFDHKDNTLFLGNLKYQANYDLDIKNAILESGIKAKDLIKFVKVPLLLEIGNQYYPYTNQNQFSSDKIMGFKGGENYVFGFMLLDIYDRWSSIIAFKDEVKNELYPEVTESIEEGIKKYNIKIVQALINTETQDDNISKYQKLLNIINEIGNSKQVKFKAIKFVIVSKNQAQRNVICLGVLSLTVFSEEDRIGHDLPFAQSSWFFRPIMRDNPETYNPIGDNSYVLEFRHYAPVKEEILSLKPNSGSFGYNKYQEASSPYANGHTRYGVDSQILTMHSPDIEFDSAVLKLLDDNEVLKFRIAGYTKVHSTYSDADISLERNRFFYENGNTPSIGEILLNKNKQVISYNQIVPAAGLCSYFGAYGKTYLTTPKPEENGQYVWNGYYKIYPWHRSTSINALPTPTVEIKANQSDSNGKGEVVIDEQYWQFPLKEKKMSNSRVCCKTMLGGNYIWRPIANKAEDVETGISSIGIWYPTSKLLKLRDSTEPWSNEFTYEGNVDTVINVTDTSKYSLNVYMSKLDNNAISLGDSVDLIRMKYKSTTHAVFSLNFNRYTSNFEGTQISKYQLWILPSIKYGTVSIPKSESVNGVSWDNTLSVVPLDTIREYSMLVYDATQNQRFYYNLDDENERLKACLYLIREFNIPRYDYERRDDKDHLYEKGYTINFSVVVITSWESEEQTVGNYKLLEYRREYILDDSYDPDDLYPTRDEEEASLSTLEAGKHIKYGDIYYIILDDTRIKKLTAEEKEQSQSVGNNIYTTKDYAVDNKDDGIFYIGELYQDFHLSTADYELENYNWLAASDAISIYENNIPNLYGDTYFQRYDCLKTYSAGPDDPNQVVDIGSFMLETRINMDGRYDRNRGLLSNLNITDTNFNLINKAYTQNDYFVNTYINNSNLDVSEYPNTITWSLTKVYGEPIDNWTHLTNTSNLDLDGERGTLTKIVNFQDVLLFFLTEGAGIIKYNENVALAATNELPIELANSGKVDGKLYLNRIIGCLNKDTIVVTKNALYFIDGNTNSIYQMTLALSLANPESITENSFENFMKALDISTAKGFYNKDKQEVYYIFDNEKAPCIAYSENTKQFTSFYDYKPSFFECIGETAYHILNSELNTFSIWALNKGDYNHFYGTYKPFYITVSANGEDGIVDKIWNNVEFRADTYNDNKLLSNITFDELNVWNEHQVGTAKLTLYGNNGSINSPSNLKKKFRIWRTNIPRSQYVACPKFNKGINVTIENSIFKNQVDLGRGRNRIRNPWTYIQLKNSNPDAYKTILHDLMVYYFE